MASRREFLGIMFLAPLVALVRGRPKTEWHHVVGVFKNNTVRAWVNGTEITDYAVWNRTLEGWEIKALGKGVPPTYFPKGLAEYWPTHGGSGP